MKVHTVQHHEWAINDVIPLHQVLAILYKGGEAAQQEPRLLGTIENQVRLSSALAGQGAHALCPAQPAPMARERGSRIHCEWGRLAERLRMNPRSSQVSDDKEGPDSVFQKNIVDVRANGVMVLNMLLIRIILGRGAHYDSFPPRISHP